MVFNKNTSLCKGSNYFDIYGVADKQAVNYINKSMSLPNSNFFKEKVILVDAKVQAQKPDIGAIQSINLSVDILRKKIISTPGDDIVTNLEGVKSTGKKIIIEGALNLSIQYISMELRHEVYNFNYGEYFSTYIMLNNQVKLEDNFSIIPYVESFMVSEIYPRKISACTNLFLVASRLSINDYDKEIEEDSDYEMDIPSSKNTNDITTFLGPQDKEWTNINIKEKYTIPKNKPDIGKVINITSNIIVRNQRVVLVPIKPPVSSGGNIFKEKKLLIDLILNQDIIYNEFNNEDNLISVQYGVPYSIYISINDNCKFTDSFIIDSCIEDLHVNVLDKRNMFENISIFFKVNKKTYF
ncbi:hypothetical protein SAMN02745163_03203 [Clostridium cavendishii DSM 21758]|uniref:SipL SPOCS domain-containing protein n=1 Tax=Clostridium cavendishii DSM 21758 TaxID=1121302 RepID=A0A1M6PMP6_9CLOT|nr:DUF3794 domain-containing protein [Clostridium cavendishii]SHK09193.1 hypothetical protein SAMN02745163_03203 [Clostridium cavendishii DSM 21758]